MAGEIILSDSYDGLARFTARYEWYVSGGTTELADISSVPINQRPEAAFLARYLHWKYAEGLAESELRGVDMFSEIEFYRPPFFVIRGGKS